MVKVSALSAIVGDYAPTNCTFSNLAVESVLHYGPGPFTRSLSLSNHQLRLCTNCLYFFQPGSGENISHYGPGPWVCQIIKIINNISPFLVMTNHTLVSTISSPCRVDTLPMSNPGLPPRCNWLHRPFQGLRLAS